MIRTEIISYLHACLVSDLLLSNFVWYASCLHKMWLLLFHLVDLTGAGCWYISLHLQSHASNLVHLAKMCVVYCNKSKMLGFLKLFEKVSILWLFWRLHFVELHCIIQSGVFCYLASPQWYNLALQNIINACQYNAM